MSVADGQLFLQPRPPGEAWRVSARDSVSRIGQAAASPALRAVGGGSARLQLAQADDADVFGAASARGGGAHAVALRLRAALDQRPGAPRPLSDQVATLLALAAPAMVDTPVEGVRAAIDECLAAARRSPAAAAALSSVDATGELSAAAEAVLRAALAA